MLEDPVGQDVRGVALHLHFALLENQLKSERWFVRVREAWTQLMLAQDRVLELVQYLSLEWPAFSRKMIEKAS